MPRRQLVIAENHRVIVEGIVKSIQRAHDSLGNANVTVSKTELFNASINRSPAACAHVSPGLSLPSTVCASAAVRA
jgi:hypothetical protein